MTTKTKALFATLLFTAAPLHAQNAPSVESRLRDQLKTMAGQLRTAENERATLQAEKMALDEKAKALETKLIALGKDLETEKSKAKAEGEKLRADITAKNVELDETKAQLKKATEFGSKAAQLAEKTRAERDKLAAEALQLKRVVADQRAKNGKMYELGNEILTRYQKFGLGTALTAREPFVGITRARLETLVEEYGGKLAEQRLKQAGPAPVAKPSQETSKKAAGAASDAGRPRD